MKRTISLSLGVLVLATLANLVHAKTVINVDFAPTINYLSVTTNIYTIDYVGTAAAPDTGTIWNHITSNNASPAGFIGAPGYYDGMSGPSTDSTIVNSFGVALPEYQ